jgi:hypothetical protein
MPLLGASAFGALDLEIDLYTAAILSALRLRDQCRLLGRPVVVLVIDVLLDKALRRSQAIFQKKNWSAGI